ncbi:hypothetical protein NOCA2480040 [metagenome]|uniref:Uncharacterized protein n=1 Tax=metagenome TaxID=256318 RepID=A0A2P2C7L5_9ZZZZ
MMKFQFEEEVDYFEIDPVAYAPALGEIGMAAYRNDISTTFRIREFGAGRRSGSSTPQCP